MSSENSEMLEKLSQHRKEISRFLDVKLDEWEAQEENPGRWRQDIRERLSEMVKGGKMVRGSLVIITHDIYGGKNEEDCLRTAAAIELLHTGILMHDDIIDKDDHRRGMQTFKKQYQDLAEEESIDDGDHFGISMGLAGGDVSFFLGQNLISKIESNGENRGRIMELVFDEFANVGLAEQVDVYAGYSQNELDEDEIMKLYRDKTARYTFSLPFNAGAILAGVDEEEQEKLYRLGEKMGVIFQLKDDELGLFGEEDQTGKSVGSDLDENKKTLHRHLLLHKLPEDEREDLKQKLRGELSREEKTEIIEMMEEKGVREEVRGKMENIAEDTIAEIDELDLDEESKNFLRKMTDFCLNRKK